MSYNVLWIDDEYKTRGISFITLAEQDDINIDAVESHDEGMLKLKEKDGFYDAVILDAKVKLNKESETTNLKGLRASRDFLIEYNKDNVLPYFIYTGQPDYQKNSDFEDSYGRFYIKGIDNEKLLEDIKKKADKSPKTQVRLNFSEVFVPFENGIIDKKHEHLLLDILINYQNKNYLKKNVNVQRDLLEAIFKALNNPIPFITNDFFEERLKGKPNLENCVKFIEGKRRINRLEYSNDKTIEKTIQSAFRILKESTSELSHLSDDAVVKYPFLSNTFLLLQILIWLPEFAKEHYEHYF
ncbi:hypothetical protein [uncultured Lacinutrix sp.]|uniref:hypothetical protein n=1 Tax=uncultured Lacinutrix sp. TaxID=574032 RepID=UPI0026165A3B|nr:hypothetical protein [uncultured Lacinutrix sp.]